RLRLAADLYNLGIIRGFASADRSTVEIRAGSYELPFGMVSVTTDPSALEWHYRRIVALTPVDELELRGLTNRYHHAGLAARPARPPAAAARASGGRAPAPAAAAPPPPPRPPPAGGWGGPAPRGGSCSWRASPAATGPRASCALP